MEEFDLVISDHMLFEGRGMFAAGAEASTFAADASVGLGNHSSQGYAARTQDERRGKGKDVSCGDWPDLLGFEDFGTAMRNFDHAFEIGSSYFDDALCSTICSPDAQFVPSSCFDDVDLSAVLDESTTDHESQSSVSVPDQVNTTHCASASTQQKSRATGERRNTPLNRETHASSSSGEVSQHSVPEITCPFDGIAATANQTVSWEGLEAIFCASPGMRAPAASSTMHTGGTVPSSTCSVTDLVAGNDVRPAKRPHDPSSGAPDMILEEMAENPLDMYFPPLTTYEEQPEILMSQNSSARTYRFPGEFAGSGVQNRAGGLRSCSKEMTSAGLPEQRSSATVLEAVPVKDLGFQKLQEGINQLDMASKGRIRDALYRLANNVEQRHGVAGAYGVGSSGSKRSKTGRWTETQTNPMDQSVAKLLLQKPSYRKTVLPHR